MNIVHYIKDRAVLLVAWLFAFAIALLVIYLDLETGQQYVRQTSLLYAILLSLVVLTAGIIIDYYRQREWYKEMQSAMNHLSDTDFTLCLQHPVTVEQSIVHALITRQYAAYTSELLMMRQQREQHVHFTNQWVHHMKTPVSVLHLMTQQASQSLDTDSYSQEWLQSIDEETERLERGLEMMLNTARLEKFELDLRVERVSLQHAIRQVINQHKKTFIRTSIFPKIIGEDIHVASDPKWLQFILTQFVTNAIKYSRVKEGAQTLEFFIERTSQGAKLHVRDEGIGIAEHDIPRVFEAFFTGENGRKEGDATGMGLYLVKEVCARLGHKVSVQSTLGEGTTLTLEFTEHSMHRDLDVKVDLQFLR